MKTAGLDIGSITTKAAVIEDGNLLGTLVDLTGYNAAEAGRRVYGELLEQLHLKPSDIERTVSTGYGRSSADFADRAVTEITCHGVGAYFQDPQVRTLIDIGGQDSKVLAIDPDGTVRNFIMNDKCAAGTGRFLEVMARALSLNLDELGTVCREADRPAKISSTCTVFAESEVISLIARGESRPNILAGIHDSVAARAVSLVHRVGVAPPVMMTGGVARNSGVVRALEKHLGLDIKVLETAQVNGAIGAAIVAAGH